MSVWNKVLAGLIFVTALGLFFFSARALRTHAYWRDHIENKQKPAIEKAREDIVRLTQGTKDEPGKWQLERELHGIVAGRGRTWRGVVPDAVEPQPNGDVSVRASVAQPDPHGIEVKTVLQVFEEADTKQAGGQYIGSFVVTGVAAKQVQMAPAMRFSPRELQRAQQSLQAKRTWVFYDVMPSDAPDVFAGMTDEQIRAAVPETAAEHFVKKDRSLRDYRTLFLIYHQQRSRLIDQMEIAKHDIQSLKASVADAQKQQEFRTKEIEGLKGKLAQVQKERDAVVAHLNAVKAKNESLQAAVADLIKQNQAMAGEIARMQRAIVQAIDGRTNGVAQASQF